MKISSGILNKINEAEEVNYNEFNKQIALLIADEEEAIDGYNKAIEILKDKMTNEQFDEIYRTLNHIIDEEKEHIEELNKLKQDVE